MQLSALNVFSFACLYISVAVRSSLEYRQTVPIMAGGAGQNL